MGGENMVTGSEGPCAGLSPEEWFSDPACAAAWDEFYEWALDQTWGPGSELTGAEQFQLMLNKLQELGLPLSPLTP